MTTGAEHGPGRRPRSRRLGWWWWLLLAALACVAFGWAVWDDTLTPARYWVFVLYIAPMIDLWAAARELLACRRRLRDARTALVQRMLTQDLVELERLYRRMESRACVHAVVGVAYAVTMMAFGFVSLEACVIACVAWVVGVAIALMIVRGEVQASVAGTRE